MNTADSKCKITCMKFALPAFTAIFCWLNVSSQTQPVQTSESANFISDTSFLYNPDYKLRDSLLGLSPDWQNNPGGIERFYGIDVQQLKKLIELRFANPNYTHNETPSINTIYTFMLKYPQIEAEGFAVSPLRKDYRIAIEGLYVPKENVTSKLQAAFQRLCATADDKNFYFDLYCWWD